MTATRSTAKSFTKYQEHSDDTVTAHFADGSSVTGDVLVAADGPTRRSASSTCRTPRSSTRGSSRSAARSPSAATTPS